MTRKVVLSLVLILAAALVLSACATATPVATPEVTEAATDAPVATPEETEAVAEVPEACATEGACAVFAAGEPIKIGFGGPMTGDNSAYGIDESQGVKLALEAVGEFEGRTFEVDAQDDLGSPDGGAAVANKLSADPAIVAVVGHAFSGATTNAMVIYAGKNIPMVSPSATRIDLTQGGNPVFNRVVGSDAVQGELAANYIFNEMGVKQLALIHDGGAYGQGLAERAQSVYEELGGEVVAFEAITVGEKDFTPVLTKIAALKPGAIFFGGYTAEAAVLVNQKGGVGLADVPFISDDGIYGTQFIDLTKENANGVYATSAAPPSGSDTVTAFNETYKAAYGVEAGSMSSYPWYSYDAAMIIVEAIKKVAVVSGDNLYIPREELVAAVRGTSGYAGLTGDVTCDENGECSKGGFDIFLITDGKWGSAPKK